MASPSHPGSHLSTPTLLPPYQSVPTAGSSSPNASTILEAPSGENRGARLSSLQSPQPEPLTNAKGSSLTRSAPSEPLGGVTTHARAHPPWQSMYNAPTAGSSSIAPVETQSGAGVKQDLEEGSPIRGLLMSQYCPSTSAQNSSADQLETLPQLLLPYSPMQQSSPADFCQTEPFGHPTKPPSAPHQANNQGNLGAFQGFAKPTQRPSIIFEPWAPAAPRPEPAIPGPIKRPPHEASSLPSTKGRTSNMFSLSQASPSSSSTDQAAQDNPPTTAPLFVSITEYMLPTLLPRVPIAVSPCPLIPYSHL